MRYVRAAIMTMDIARIAQNLRQQDDGIWIAQTQHAIAYPEIGNEASFALEEHSFWFQHRNRCILAYLKRFPPAGALFDIGGGNGFVAQALHASGFPVALVEPGPAGAKHGKQRGIPDVICATLADAQFLPRTLPAIGMFDVLEHIDDDAAALASVHRVLVDAGLLYLTVPAYSWLWSYEDEYAGHCRRYTCASLRTRLRRAGFDVLAATYIFSFLPAPVLLWRTLPTLLGMRRHHAAQTAATEHQMTPGLGGRFLNWLLRKEHERLVSGGVIPFGGSCLVVAKKRATES